MFSTLEFAQECPAGFAALPEPYQADDCLEFWKVVEARYHHGFQLYNKDIWFARPMSNQVSALGNFTARWDPTLQSDWYSYIPPSPQEV